MQKFIKYPLSIVIVVIICVTLVASMHQLTSPILEARKLEVISSSLEGMYDNIDTIEVLQENDASMTITYVYKLILTDESKKIVYQTSEIGKSVPIGMLISFDELGIIERVVYTQMNETKGIGTKVTEEEFINKIIGYEASKIEIDAITGATLSSDAVIKSINAATIDFENNYKGGKNE